MTKALFFDIDGTLVSFQTHEVPASTIEALERAKAYGVGIYISTGRPYALINNIGSISHLVDGYISTNGAYCFVGDEVISSTPIPTEGVRQVLDKADEMNFACLVVGEKECFMYHPLPEAEALFSEILDIDNLDRHVPKEDILKMRILQMTPFITEQQERQIVSNLSGVDACRWHPAFADFTAAGVSKAKGLREIALHHHLDIAHTMAFGDGGNDIAIIQAAGIGVAMGNANDDVKTVADYVTTSVDEDGISHALRHWRVI